MLLLCNSPVGLLVPRRQPPLNSSRSPHLPVFAAKDSPWGSQPDKRSSGSGSSGQPKGKSSGSSKKAKPSSKSSSQGGRDAQKKPKSTTSGQGFGPQAQVKPATPVYKITPPLTPKLLDELSPWESAAAPLWGTFTGHSEGEWLGQYSAYTPWGGDPEPVWADESGAYLTHAFCRVSEERQSVPADAADSTDDDAISSSSSSGSSSGSSNAVSHQQQQQDPEQGEMLDLLVRSTLRSASISSLIGGVSTAAAAAAAVADNPTSSLESAAAAGSSDAAQDDELEAIAYNTNGSVVFNGGSYSLGPELIEVPEADEEAVAEYYAALEDAAAAAAAAAADADVAGGTSSDEGEPQDPLSCLPFSTVLVEQALVAAGDKRMRLVATLKVRRPPGQELDIEVARLLLYKEYWYGTADSTSSNGSSKRSLSLLPSHSFEVPVTQLPRPQPTDLSGTWNVFVLAANLAVEENPNTLQDETVVLYSSREERQHWHVPTLTSSAAPAVSSSKQPAPAAGDGDSSKSDAQLEQASQESDDDDSGGSFWLPGGAVVSLRMVANSSDTGAGDNSSSSTRPHRGLLVGLHLLDAAGSCLFVEREYDAEGALLEVRQGTAVKGGWSGGRM